MISIIPPFPPLPQTRASPPFAITEVFAETPSEFQTLIVPPEPPRAVPTPPLEIIIAVVDVPTVIEPPEPPVPLLFECPLETRFPTAEDVTKIFPPLSPQVPHGCKYPKL